MENFCCVGVETGRTPEATPGSRTERKPPPTQKTPSILYTTTSWCTKILDSMAQYFVAKRLGEYTPSFVRGFNNLDDARQFRNLMASSEKNNWEYFIVEVIE